MRIIDKEIDLFVSFVEEHERQLRSCVPAKEQEHRTKMLAAREVLAALEEYRAVIDAYSRP